MKTLGLGDKGVTTYFSSNCTDNDAKLVADFMQSKRIEFYNTRCFKTESKSGDIHSEYEIRLASTTSQENPNVLSEEEIFKKSKFKVTRGDYDIILSSVVENLELAKEHAANDMEVSMIQKYIEHFTSGCSEDHKNACRSWIKNKSPDVETFIGFLESYRDPAGQRGEFEAFVGIVDRQMSDKFAVLVDGAQKFISTLPWGKDFEKDKFLMPDFTSLDILMWSSSIIPSGKTVPNYSEMRQSEGFKNLSLGNVIFANIKQDTIPFLSESDQELMNKYQVASFEIQVGLHELLGHGSGKLLRKLDDGSFNFDSTLKNPVTGEPVTNYYVGGETYNTVFGPLSSPFEECKAEAVGLYLSLNKDIVKIFGFEGREAEDIVYVNWLSLFWGGFAKALEMYQPSSGKWLQAHSQARYVLLRVCLEAGQDFVKVVETEPGKNLRLTLDRGKLHTVGKSAIGDFLLKLQVFKSTADLKSAKEMFDRYSEVPEFGSHPWAKWRDVIMSQRRPRKIFVQPNTFIDDSGAVIFKNYEPNFEGFIESWTDRFPSPKVSDALIELYERDAKFFLLPNAEC
ncbi:hypothetical protein QAD02_005526 [Eretmocerus hayati]|uniref:Uncharacterized protein n=1 Tax=Eretmocerus hayati TaxID=131215 RepID=A0ACC2NT37_9HYME|nr:hypothetical protein QAD02_005526 [Eretmocerus hayati]